MNEDEAKPAPRIGVMIPTYRRPDLTRACVLQWLVQALPPACICVHQNGSAASYRDVTQRVLALCTREGDADGRWELPADDRLRGLHFGDPAPNELKHLVLRALPDASGRLVDRVLRDTERCRFRYARGVLSVAFDGAP